MSNEKTKFVELKAHQHPNAVCAICRLSTRIGGGRLAQATHEIQKPNLVYRVCGAHAERSMALTHLLSVLS